MEGRIHDTEEKRDKVGYREELNIKQKKLIIKWNTKVRTIREQQYKIYTLEWIYINYIHVL